MKIFYYSTPKGPLTLTGMHNIYKELVPSACSKSTFVQRVKASNKINFTDNEIMGFVSTIHNQLRTVFYEHLVTIYNKKFSTSWTWMQMSRRCRKYNIPTSMRVSPKKAVPISEPIDYSASVLPIEAFMQLQGAL